MIEATKEIVIALINNKQICNYGDNDANIQQLQSTIKAVYQALENTKLIRPIPPKD